MGRWGLALQAVGRRSGLAGVLVAAGGAAATVAAAMPWWQARAELQLLSASQGRVVSSLGGWQHAIGWTAATAGMLALTLGALLAVDRHPGWTRPAAVAAGLVLVGCAAVGLARDPGLGAFPDEDGALADLRSVTDDLPVEVDLELTVTRGAGPWWVTVAAGAVLVGTLSARELDRH